MSDTTAVVEEIAFRMEEYRHTIAVLELEKAQYKLKAKTLGLKVTHLERLYKAARGRGMEARHERIV